MLETSVDPPPAGYQDVEVAPGRFLTVPDRYAERRAAEQRQTTLKVA